MKDNLKFTRLEQMARKVAIRLDGRHITDRIKTIDDAICDLGEHDEEVISYRKLIAILKPTHHLVATQAVIIIVKSLNDGWVPDWSNLKEKKYFPWFEMGGSSGFRFLGCDYWCSDSLVGSRLCFKSRELAEHAGKQFIELYKQFFM